MVQLNEAVYYEEARYTRSSQKSSPKAFTVQLLGKATDASAKKDDTCSLNHWVTASVASE